MSEIQENIMAIKNTLASIQITATEDNLGKLLACQQLLSTIYESLGKDDADVQC